MKNLVRYFVVDENLNYPVQFLTFQITDGTSSTLLQSIPSEDINIAKRLCSFKTLDKAIEFANLMQLQNDRLMFEHTFNIQKVIFNCNKTYIKNIRF